MLGVGFGVQRLTLLLVRSFCFVFAFEDVSSRFSPPAATPACGLLTRFSARTNTILSGTVRQINSSHSKLPLVVVFLAQ